MKPEHRTQFFAFAAVLILAGAGIVLLVEDGAGGKSAIAAILFIATGVVASKTGFGKIS